MADDVNNRRARKKTDIMIEPKNMVLLRASREVPGIVVIDEETQRKYPSLVVSPTATVQKRDIELFLKSEPDVSSNK
jgi:hypothetical protein